MKSVYVWGIEVAFVG